MAHVRIFGLAGACTLAAVAALYHIREPTPKLPPMPPEVKVDAVVKFTDKITGNVTYTKPMDWVEAQNLVLLQRRVPTDLQASAFIEGTDEFAAALKAPGQHLVARLPRYGP